MNGASGFLRLGGMRSYRASMGDLEKRSYTPRRVRERRLYTYGVTAFVTGSLGLVGLVLAVFGVIGAALPILALIVAGVCIFMARRVLAG